MSLTMNLGKIPWCKFIHHGFSFRFHIMNSTFLWLCFKTTLHFSCFTLTLPDCLHFSLSWKDSSFGTLNSELRQMKFSFSWEKPVINDTKLTAWIIFYPESNSNSIVEVRYTSEFYSLRIKLSSKICEKVLDFAKYTLCRVQFIRITRLRFRKF